VSGGTRSSYRCWVGSLAHNSLCVGGLFVATHSGETRAAGAERFGTPQFELEDRIDGARHTLALNGELDMACSPLLEGRLRQICAEDGIEEVLLDLSRLAFIDSTGLRAILLAEELCERHACKLAMVPGQPQVQRLFEVSGLVDRLPFTTPGNRGE
jgi:anti-sigma B factor antagonist